MKTKINTTDILKLTIALAVITWVVYNYTVLGTPIERF